MSARVQWTKTRRGFVACSQGGERIVDLVNARHFWRVKLNGSIRRIGSSEQSAKRYGRLLLLANEEA